MFESRRKGQLEFDFMHEMRREDALDIFCEYERKYNRCLKGGLLVCGMVGLVGMGAAYVYRNPGIYESIKNLF